MHDAGLAFARQPFSLSFKALCALALHTGRAPPAALTKPRCHAAQNDTDHKCTHQVGIERQLNGQRSLAMTMAIMTQVAVARTRYHYLRKSAETAAQYHDVQQKLLRQLRASESTGAESEQALIREEMNALVASAEYDVAYSDLQNAFGTIYATIGVDPWGDYLDTASDVETLSASLRQVWRERGDFGG